MNVYLVVGLAQRHLQLLNVGEVSYKGGYEKEGIIKVIEVKSLLEGVPYTPLNLSKTQLLATPSTLSLISLNKLLIKLPNLSKIHIISTPKLK